MEKQIDEAQVRKVAKLARLELSDREIHEFTGQLGAILEYVKKMDELDTTSVEPLAHCLALSNRLRPFVSAEADQTGCVKYLPLVLLALPQYVLR